MISLKGILTEKFELDLEIGDTILRGKFKNKPVVVKDFGVDDKGQPTINGKKMLSFRIKKLMPKYKDAKITEAGFKNLTPFEHKLRVALKGEEKQKDFPIKVLQTIQLVKVLGRGKLKSSEEKIYKQLLKKYKLKEGKLTEAGKKSSPTYPTNQKLRMFRTGKKKAASNFKVLFRTSKEESIGRKIRLGDKRDPGHEVWQKVDKMNWMNLKTKKKLDVNKWAKHADSFHMKGKDLQFEAKLTEGKPIPMDTPNEFAYLDFKKFAYKNRKQYKKDMQKHIINGEADSSRMFMTASAWWFKWAYKNNKNFIHIKDKLKFGRALLVMMVKDDLIFDKKAWKKDNRITHIK